MPHVIRYFDKCDESYLGEIELSEIPITVLQTIFSVEKNNPMYDSFAIDNEHLEAISGYVSIPLEMNKYDYFLEYDA